MPRTSRPSNHLLLVVSDIEMGGGGVVDDFPQSDFFESFLEPYQDPSFKTTQIDLVFNGDTFDFLKISLNKEFPHFVSAEIALEKFKRISDFHPRFFVALKKFLSVSSLLRKVYFIVGNHDLELLFPETQEAIRRVLEPYAESVLFPGLSIDIGKVHIEHGHQKDSMFQLNPENLFLEHEGQKIINLPWGNIAIIESLLPFQPILYHFDRIKPRNTLLKIIPELKEFLFAQVWDYWMNKYWKSYWKGVDPLKKVTWSLLKELTYRFRTKDTSISIRKQYFEEFQQQDDFLLYIIGHEHEGQWMSADNKKLFQTGAFRNEYYLEIQNDEAVQSHLPIVYAEVWMEKDDPVYSQLIEIAPPAVPENYVVEDLFFVSPLIKGLLGDKTKRQENQEKWESQEAMEAYKESN